MSFPGCQHDPVMADLRRHLDREDAYEGIDRQREAFMRDEWEGENALLYVAPELLSAEEIAELGALLKYDPAQYGVRCQQIARRNLEREAARKFPYDLVFLRKQAD